MTTIYKESVIDSEVCTYLYNHLKNNVPWVDGVRSKNGFTRKAYPVSIFDPLYEELYAYIDVAIKQLTDTKYTILGVYLNYYENGDMYTPNHSHKDTHQLVLSLGEQRTLMVGKKQYFMKNGDAIIFGSSVHGVPKMNTDKGRISIATFMKSE